MREAGCDMVLGIAAAAHAEANQGADAASADQRDGRKNVEQDVSKPRCALALADTFTYDLVLTIIERGLRGADRWRR